MNATFKKGDLVKVVSGLNELNGTTGKVVKVYHDRLMDRNKYFVHLDKPFKTICGHHSYVTYFYSFQLEACDRPLDIKKIRKRLGFEKGRYYDSRLGASIHGRYKEGRIFIDIFKRRNEIVCSLDWTAHPDTSKIHDDDAMDRSMWHMCPMIPVIAIHFIVKTEKEFEHAMSIIDLIKTK